MKRLFSPIILIGIIVASLYINRLTIAQWTISSAVDRVEIDIRFAASVVPLYPLYVESQELATTETQVDPQKALKNFEELDANLQKAKEILQSVAPYNEPSSQIKESLMIMVTLIDKELPRHELKKMKSILLLPFIDYDYLTSSITAIGNELNVQYQTLELHLDHYQRYLQTKLEPSPYLSVLTALFSEDEKKVLIKYTENEILAIAKENPYFFEVLDHVSLVQFRDQLLTALREEADKDE